MNRSEQTPAVGRSQIREPRDRMLVAAHVFSNYILMPPRRHPDETQSRPTLQGAALLVFADQLTQKIELGARDAAHVRSHADRGPREKLVNELVNLHKENSVKQSSPTLACSACHMLIAPGMTTCPNCRLPLTAQAVPVIRRPTPIWPYILVAIFAFFVFANILAANREQNRRDATAALVADLGAGKLGTPDLFEARCGQPAAVKQTKDGPELHYLAGGESYYITFASSGPRFEFEHADVDGAWRSPAEPDVALNDLGCK